VFVNGWKKDRLVSQEAQAALALKRGGHTGIPKEFSIQMKRSIVFAITLASGLPERSRSNTVAPATPAVPAKVAVIASSAVGQTTSSSATSPTCRRSTNEAQPAQDTGR